MRYFEDVKGANVHVQLPGRVLFREVWQGFQACILSKFDLLGLGIWASCVLAAVLEDARVLQIQFEAL